jgi:hypothetical protein
MKRYSKIANVLMIGVIFLSSCNNDITIPQSTNQWVTTHTISAFIKNFSTDIGDLPTRTPSLFSVDTIPTNQNIVINGVVISNDTEGNIYKNLIIEDYVSGRALKIAVDAGNLSSIFPTGRSISINCSGLAIGKYAQMLQLGIPFYNTTSGKTGFEIGRIPYTLFMTKVQLNSTSTIPVSQLVDTVTIAQIRNSGREMDGKLVCIKNAFFTGYGADYGLPKAITVAEQIFAPSTNGIGFPQAREIQDGTGSVFIATSEYSKFAALKLPSPTLRGNITAIVGWYNDKDVVVSSTKIYHQLTLRSISDLGKGFERFHQGLINN